ncbi:Uncharacterized conserved protein YbbK, DUF523 family [Atopomonas hussainii]|uniref:Uncharacterized conserved protein YbbK, DUF523 family n=1 Tax=Atopomonas hussainii TaxID=1429083 RepID=A0A1H7HWI2_9GAMM|nr:DUF523 domain-containing protein [Atopomonas hussainii]SEK54504.1 Uncharacterized conserved protein YbbK, DUF523 family [Atopomonas hussainii]
MVSQLKPRLLVSACLLGQRVRYDGRLLPAYPQLLAWQAQGLLVVLCPEVAGGLPVPRLPAEVPGGQGELIWRGAAGLCDSQGHDVSQAFRHGAAQAVQLAQQHDLRWALLKARSPSCGNQHTYDGSFTGTLVSGEGVTAAALRLAGVTVFCEDQLADVERLMLDV